LNPTFAMSQRTKSQRSLGLWMCTALVVGNMIGSGVFLLPASLAPYGTISIVGWLFTSAGAILLALTFARLSRRVQSAGGPYTYTRAGFGDFAGFLVAWGYWISIWAGNAAISVAFASYLSVFLPAIGASTRLAAMAALLAIWALTIVNVAGVRSAGIVQLVTTIMKLIPLVGIALFGLFYLDPSHFSPLNPSSESSFSAVSACAALTLWAFLGLESATIPADDVKDPSKTIPRATVIGTIIAAVVYVLGTVAVMGVLPRAALSDSIAPFSDAAAAMWGSWAGYLVAAGAMVAAFGALNGWILLQGQLPMAAARDGVFPAAFARMSRRGTPAVGIVISSGLASVLIIMNFTRGLVGAFTFILLLATLTVLFAYALCSMAELLLAAKEKNGLKKKLTLAASIIPSLAFLYSLWAIGGSGRDTVYWGFLLLLAGVPFYVFEKIRGHPCADG
jgi:APA family basic amino acid/polyamine antiporter